MARVQVVCFAHVVSDVRVSVPPGALESARTVHAIYAAEFGDDHERTKECFAQVTGLTAEAVAVARAKKVPHPRKPSRSRKADTAAPTPATDTNTVVVSGAPDTGPADDDDAGAYTPVSGAADKKKKKRGHTRGKRTTATPAVAVDGDQPRR